MRILFSTRSNYESQPGGDSLHLEQTAASLRQKGHQIDIWAGEEIEAKDYDLIHHFNLGRPSSLLPLLKLGLPLVVSSIFVDYREADQKASPLRRLLVRGLGADGLEYLKTLARALRGREKWPPLSYLLQGQRAGIARVLDSCKHLICASQAEADLIQSIYPHHSAVKAIPLGLEHLPPKAGSESDGSVLCIARLEALKNQTHLIEACQELNLPLKLVGEAAPAHQKYYQYCNEIAGPKTQFFPRATKEECRSHYEKASVHVLASFYESTGLVSLEALALGCQIVVNDHPIQRELFGDRAHYCNPHDPHSIAQAIQSALSDSRNHQDWVRENFSWEKAAGELETIYRDIVSS